LGGTAALFPIPLRDRSREGSCSQHPKWKSKEPVASLIKGDVKVALAGGEKAILEVMAATHSGITTEEFEKVDDSPEMNDSARAAGARGLVRKSGDENEIVEAIRAILRDKPVTV
jgi:Response regulator containing a CheY-like receiver domain and an HTH DNA-binding domain